MSLTRDIQRVLDHADSDIIQLGISAKSDADREIVAEGQDSYRRAAPLMQAAEDLLQACKDLLPLALLYGKESTPSIRAARAAIEKATP